MKLIGLIGGVTWVSTLEYYRLLNTIVAEERGGLHSARLALYSIDFAEMAAAQEAENWNRVAEIVIHAARALQAAGAEIFVICANTLHLVYDQVVGETGLPFVHIVDAVGEEAKRLGISTLGLTGTRHTMEKPFYRERLETLYGLTVLIPPDGERVEVHRIIYEDLGRGVVSNQARRFFRGVVERLATDGAEAVVLGCTELPLLARPEETGVRLLNPLVLQCREALRKAREVGDAGPGEGVSAGGFPADPGITG